MQISLFAYGLFDVIEKAFIYFALNSLMNHDLIAQIDTRQTLVACRPVGKSSSVTSSVKPIFLIYCRPSCSPTLPSLVSTVFNSAVSLLHECRITLLANRLQPSDIHTSSVLFRLPNPHGRRSHRPSRSSRGSRRSPASGAAPRRWDHRSS